MNNTFYFPHDYNAGQDFKIIALISQHSASGYGVFWRIIEMLHNDDSHKIPHNEMIWNVICTMMKTPVEDIKSIIDTCIEYNLLYLDENNLIYSNRVNYNIELRKEQKDQKKNAGKKSAENRLKKMMNDSSTDDKHTFNERSTDVQHSFNGYPTKERKGKERKEKDNIDISYSQDFEIVWANYGKEGSKKMAFKIWDKMEDPIKDKIAKSIPGYLNHLSKTGFAKKHFTSYLNSDEYENYLNFSTLSSGEIKVEQIKILPNLSNNFEFSLIHKLKGLNQEQRWEYYRANRPECSEVFQHTRKYQGDDYDSFCLLDRTHPLRKFTADYHNFVEYENDNV